MAYTNAIFYLDYELGNDAARTALTSVAFTNNGGVVRATKATHGLVTGACVTITLSTSYNAEWLVNKIDNDIFELYITNPSGTITVSGTPVADETFVVSSQTFTFKASRSGAGEVTISANNIQQAKNIVTAIMADLGSTIFAYCHETAIVTVRNIIGGTAGNTVVLTESATGIAVSGSGTLAGGVNSTYIADRTGTVTPKGGQSFADAWKSINLGATAARKAPLDITCIAKSSVPASVGDATWNNLSRTVTLATAQTLNIDMGLDWVAANDAAAVNITGRKEGGQSARITAPASPATGTLYGYKAMSSTNFSSKQKISLWVKNEVAVSAGHWKLCLCSDNAGATIVDTVLIPAIATTGRWNKLTLTKEGGGNFGSSIQSVALWSDTVAPTASKYLYLDDMIACTTAGLNLQSLISKNSAAQGGTETWYAIQSINGVTVILDTDPGVTEEGTGRGYSGDTGSVPTYKRETIKTTQGTSTSTVVQEVMDSGTAGNYIEFQGGYNTANSVQDGETWFDGVNGYGYGLYFTSKSYVKINHLNFTGYYLGIYYNSSSNYNVITNITGVNNNANYGIYYYLSNYNIITTITGANNNGYYGINYYFSNSNVITTITGVNNNANYGIYYYYSNNNLITTITGVNNNANYGIYYVYSNNNLITTITGVNNNANYGIYYYYSFKNKILNGATSGNGTAGFYCEYSENSIYNFTIGEATEVVFLAADFVSKLHSTRHDNTDDNDWTFQNFGYNCKQATTRHTASGFAWQLHVSSSTRVTALPINCPVAKIPCVANKLVTFTAYVKKDHATNVGARILCKGGQIAGVAADVITTKASGDTNWENLTITFTPTKAGVVQIEFEAWYIAGNSDVYIDDITITQAA